MNDDEIYKSNLYGKLNWAYENTNNEGQTISMEILAQLSNARNISYTQDMNRARLAEAEMMFKSVIEYGQMAIKGGMLLNGSAAIALLAFIGNIITQTSRPHIEMIPMVKILSLFCYGSFASLFGAAMAYFTQLIYQEKNEKDEMKNKKWGRLFHVLSIFFVLSGYILFAYAVYAFSSVVVIESI